MRRVLPTAAAVAALLLLMAPLAGCLQDDVGVRCAVCGDDRCEFEETAQNCPQDCNPPPVCAGTAGCPRGEDTILDLQALSCESRVCIKYLGGSSGPRCTIPCEDDSDCPSSGVAGCSGFRCRVGLAVGGTSCCKFCVCDDDVPSKDSDPEASNCSGKPAKCPNI